MHLAHCHLVTDYDKSLYMSTWLKDGSPKSWFWAIEKTKPELLNDHAALVEDFRKHFGDSDFVNSQMEKIKKLIQHASAAKYASAFHKILVHLPIHDDLIKINMFKKGFKDDVKALFLMIQSPTTFDDYVVQAITFDNCIYVHAQELNVDRKNIMSILPVPAAPHQLHLSTTLYTPASTNPVPMKVDAIHYRGPLSTEEKQCRRSLGLCGYCSGKHEITACTALSKCNAVSSSSGSSSQQGKGKPGAH
ncbi:uncharacterized protein LAESUDRAFT_739082 [Laetiporus sulphureus 93-53]|uniref:Retrotransposon gag domain-containing protein n=1 Tax=Laetiporus sulphureus 93-53 TaxID=1314785 RepID=A0A165BSQ9_9APHY|nr:uncharacterized protein LAESUDRAFT_739082 [Laetiporus sulphureus 93-53]KZT01580.1 hypothetical protein LAESUDRAFT_739082 [Laetiporus sulphureus 93-53]